MPTEVFHTDFDTDAKLAEFYYNPAGPGPNPAPVRRVVEGGVSCAEILIGAEVPTANAVFISDGSGSAFDKMNANLNFPANSIAHCYDLDSSKHGRYKKSGAAGTGSWGTNQGSVAPAMWVDENHRRVGQMQLIFESWSRAADAYALNDGPGPYPDRLGYPNIPNLSGMTMRWRMRAQNLEMGYDTKILQHFQTRVPRIPLATTSAATGTAPGFVNAMNIATCISDKLGFGTGGPLVRNAVDYVHDSGWVDVDIPLRPLDSDWLALGGLPNKQGRPPFDQALKYVCAPAAEWLSNWTGNAYMSVFYRNPNPGTDMAIPPAAQQVKGRILIQSLGFWTP